MAESDEIDLSKLSITQLGKLAQQVAKEISKKRSEGRAWLREHGKSDLVERDVRYQNPDNPVETWSGRGEQPAWVKNALSRGLSLGDLERTDNRPLPAGERNRKRR